MHPISYSKNLKEKILHTIYDSSDIEKIRRLAFLTESNPRPVIELDLQGKILYTNPSADALFPELRKGGKKGSRYLSGFLKIKKELVGSKKEQIIREIEIDKRWYRQFFYYIPRFKTVTVFGADLTDQKKIQDEIEKSEKRYHMLFETMDYGYALQDIIFDDKKRPIDYRFVDINKAFERISNVNRNTMIGKTVNEINKNVPETKEQIERRKLYDKTAITGEPLHIETYNQQLNRYFDIYAYKPNDRQIAIIASDITRQKKLDEEKNNFISILSHELRNPLTPIMANAQFINFTLNQNKKVDITMIKDLVSVIENQATIMAGLLNDILDTAKLNLQKIELNKKKIDIADPIQNSVKACMPFIHMKQQKVSVSLCKKPVYVNADAIRIEQILINLINNASRYTQERGKITVRCTAKNGTVQISIKDNGSGMSRKKISRIFDLFQSGGQSFMGVGGLGIGLNIVKHLTLMHQGTIKAKSKGANKGSEFIVELPKVKDKTIVLSIPSQQQPQTIKIPQKKNSKILIVDDNKDISRIMQRILKGQGYEVKEADKGLAAVKIAKTFNPDIALIDIGLPDISGYKVAEMITEHGQTAANWTKPKMIAVTGYGQPKDKLMAKKAGFDNHLTKPIDLNNLMRLLS